MFLEALCDFYDLLRRHNVGDLPKEGLSLAKISYCLILSKTGELVDIMDMRTQAKNRRIPTQMFVPEQRGRSSSITPYFLSDNEKYILGIGDSSDLKYFTSFKELHNQLLDNNHPIVLFLNKLNPHELANHPVIKNYYEDIKDVNFIFRVEGESKYIHEDESLILKWWDYLNSKETVKMQCLITGEYDNISRLHNYIKGVKNAQRAGAKLISFNDQSFNSYGKVDSYNAPVGIKSMFRYTTAINYLLANRNHKIDIGDISVVFWAKKIGQYESLLVELINPTDLSGKNANESHVDYETCYLAKRIIEKCAKGEKLNYEEHNLDPHTTVNIMGISANNARLFIPFYERNNFSLFVERLVKHHQDLEIVNLHDSLSLSRIIYETISKKSKQKKPSPILVQELSRSVLTGKKYPETLYNAIITRIRADKVINPHRAAIIKACLIRKNDRKEKYTVGLNPDSNSVPYNLGRLFAVLEKAQLDAMGKLNTTLKDRYYSSASSAPASVFPALLRLSIHHTSNSEFGGYYENLKRKIMDKIPEFPKQMTLAEQGDFVLGYYHQYQNFFEKKTKNKEDKTNE